MATLSEISDKISRGNEGIELNRDELIGIRSGFDEFLRYLKAGTGDKLEASRERARPKAAGGTSGRRSKGGSGFSPLILGGLGALGTALSALTAGIAAALASLEGLRGWEVKALANIDKLGKAIRGLFPATLGALIEQKYINLRAAILRSLGFDATLKKFNSPESGLRTPLGQQILERISKLRTRILNSFGIGADGKPIVVQGKDGLKVPVAGKIVAEIMKPVNVVVNFAKGVTTYIGGAGAKLFSSLANLGIVTKTGAVVAGAAGKVLGLAGKILLPLGIIISAYDGVMSFMEKEGTFFEKFAAGIFGFVGDFVGAPLDLLKKGMSYLLKKAFGIETDENGKILPNQGLSGNILSILDEFSFEEAIKAIPEFVMKIFDAVGQFFNDATGTAKDIVGGLIDSVKAMFFGIIKSIAASFGIELKSDQEKAAERADDLYQQGKRYLDQGLRFYDKNFSRGRAGFGAQGTGLISELRALDPTRAAQLENQRLQMQGVDPTLARAATIGQLGDTSTYVDQGTTYTLGNALTSTDGTFDKSPD